MEVIAFKYSHDFHVKQMKRLAPPALVASICGDIIPA
jgi:hypothetical protein